MARRKTHWISLPGMLTITHLLLWFGLFLADSMLADAGGFINVDKSNRTLVAATEWFGLMLASPLLLLVAPRGFDNLAADMCGIVANSLLVGYGLSGAIRKLARRQFNLRWLFVLTTLCALGLAAFTFQDYARFSVFLTACTIALVWLALENAKLGHWEPKEVTPKR